MKKTITLVLCLCIILCGCVILPETQEAQDTKAPVQESIAGTQPISTDDEPVLYTEPLIAVATPLITEDTTAEDGTCIFTYRFQDIILTMEDAVVAEIITNDFLNRNDLSVAGKPVLDAAKAAYTGQKDWSAYSYSVIYDPMRLDHTVLSFYGSEIADNGGPRSTSTNVSVSYNLTTGKVLALQDILVTGYSAENLVNKILAAIDVFSQQGVLFTDYEYIISDLFSTNTPMERWYFTREGLCFFFTPYEIAPYNAGTVIAEVPYSELIGLLKDEYFPAEEISFDGSLQIQNINEADMDTYSRFTEVTLDSDGDEYIIAPKGTALNVRILLDVSENSLIPSYTVYAATGLTDGDAVMVQLTQEQKEYLQLACD